MQFNSYLWENFKETKLGISLIDFFSNYSDNFKNKANFHIIKSVEEDLNLDSEWDSLENNWQDCMWLLSYGIYTDIVTGNEISDFEDFEKIYDELIHSLAIENDLRLVGALSHCLYLTYPKICFPYIFDSAYYRLQSIFDEFGIYAPPVPKKKDLYARAFHYVELCRSLYDFRIKFGMSEYELPAFLYGFAVNIVRKYEIDDVLPEPRRAFFHVVSYENNMRFLDNADDTAISAWSGNPETQPGDIIIKYCTNPRSCIQSIWRAVTPGYLDPFFHFYKMLYIAHPVHVDPISFKEMKSDDILGQAHFVKMNMQGANGGSIEKVYYDRIIEMLVKRGMSLDGIPALSGEPEPDVPLKNEKDVEQKLLEPLLQRLGYEESDWKRQFKLRMGRGDRVYPDYVICPNEERNNEFGHWIWEAKFSIANNKQLQEDFGQAKSYALRLNCKGMGLISKEGVWLSVAPFDSDKMSHFSSKQIGEIDSFNNIFDIAGNKKGFRR